MLIKQGGSRYQQAGKGLKFLLIAESSLVLGAYLLYAACNRSQTTRKYLYDRSYLKFLLDFYYSTGELMGSNAVKKYDLETWNALEKLEKIDPNRFM